MRDVLAVSILAVGAATALPSRASEPDNQAAKASQYKEKCTAGDAGACFRLGNIYARGTGVTDDEQAAALYRKACDGGDARGCIHLGFAYDNGDGVPQDKAKAADLYHKGWPAFARDAKPYKVVRRGNIEVTTAERRIGLWFITSPAKTRAEWVRTSIRAALDLSRQNNTDLTNVSLLPSACLANSGPWYTSVGYAADGKGSLGLVGPDLVYYEWDVRVVDRPLTDEELAVAKMWVRKRNDFPSRETGSSSLWDKQALRTYIAKALHIDYSRTDSPSLLPTKYEPEP